LQEVLQEVIIFSSSRQEETQKQDAIAKQIYKNILETTTGSFWYSSL